MIDTIEIQDVRVLSETVFVNLQANYRNEQERKAREAELARERAVRQQEAARMRAAAEAAEAKRSVAEAELAAYELELRRNQLAQELDLWRTKTLKDIENTITPERVQLTVAQQLPQLAQAFQQKMGEVHVTSDAKHSQFSHYFYFTASVSPHASEPAG